MNEVIEKEVMIENMIYEIRGKQVMLDSDLVKLYCVETKRINEAVKNNFEKFPERFAFTLNDYESEKLLVENFDQKKETRGGRYKNPRVFTEQGVVMLATILKSKVATQVSIAIMDAFVEMRKYINVNNYNNNDYLKYMMQYKNKINNKIHDRFIIIDNKELYHCGASFKDLGKKCFAICKIENEEWLNNLLEIS